MARNEAICLFVERSCAVHPAFHLDNANAPIVATLCRNLDGLPLAIELAAARITVLSPEYLLAQMSDRLTLLRDGPRDLPARQQTIQDTIAWSYELLSADDQEWLRGLSVFVGGFTLEAAETLMSTRERAAQSALSALTHLVDHGLIRGLETGAEPRFAMLETVREFALKQLAERAEEQQARSALVKYLIDLGASAPSDV